MARHHTYHTPGLDSEVPAEERLTEGNRFLPSYAPVLASYSALEGCRLKKKHLANTFLNENKIVQASCSSRAALRCCR